MTKAFFTFILLVFAGTANADITVECQVGETWVDSFDLIFLTASTNGTVNIDGNTRTAKYLAFEADDGKLYWRWNFSDFSRRYVLVLGSDFQTATLMDFTDVTSGEARQGKDGLALTCRRVQ